MSIGQWILLGIIGALASIYPIMVLNQKIEENKKEIKTVFQYIVLLWIVIGGIWILVESNS